MKSNYTTFSEAGKRRANQDVCRVIEFPEYDRTLMIVCDGMGGHAMGDVAAETVCNAICKFWKTNVGIPDSETKIIDACKEASDALYTRSRVVRPIEMGTTMIMASIEGNIVTIAHCGDSRCYLLRNGEVVHQTQDHADPHWGSEVVTKCFFSMNPNVAIPDIALRAKMYSKDVKDMMDKVRDSADHLEMLIDDEMWPLPKYRELLFL